MTEDLAPLATIEPDAPTIVPEAELKPAPLPETEEEQPKDIGEVEPVETEENTAEAEPEFVTLERNGKQYQVPKELEGEFLMQGDYTKKTQATAETAKALAEREAALNQQAETSEAELDARATLKSVNAELAEYAKLTQADWDAHENLDPLGTRKHERRMQYLKDQKAELEGTVTKAQAERTERTQQETAKRFQETEEFAKKNIKGWDDKLGEELLKFAVEAGVPGQFLTANMSPQLISILHKARIGDMAIKQQSAPKPTAKPAIEPLTIVKAASSPSASRSLADLANSDDMDAYAAARKAGRTR